MHCERVCTQVPILLREITARMRSHLKVVKNKMESRDAISQLDNDKDKYDFLNYSKKAKEGVSDIISKYHTVGRLFKSREIERPCAKYRQIKGNYCKEDYNPTKIFSKSKNANIAEFKKQHNPKSIDLTKEVLRKYSEQLAKYSSLNSTAITKVG